MFSRRTRWDQTPNRLSSILGEKRGAGRRVLDLTESNPTAAGLVPDAAVLADLASAESLRYEPAAQGLRSAREAVARDYGRRGATVDPDHVILTASSSEAYSFLFKTLCDPGDDVLVPRPGYPLFDFLAAMENVEHRPYPLGYDDEWHLSVGDLQTRAADRTRAVVVVNPNNPTGSFLKNDEAVALETFCVERELAIIADEVFADFAFGPDPRRRTTVAGNSRALTFSLGGLSKSCGLPQLKLGWIVVSGPPRLRDEALVRLDVVADTFLSVGTPVQRAAPGLLARIEELQAPIRSRVETNAATLAAGAASRADVSVLRSEGGWYAVLRLPATAGEEEQVVRLLQEHDVLVHPGYFFDFPHEAFIVVSLLPRPDEFSEACSRLFAAL